MPATETTQYGGGPTGAVEFTNKHFFGMKAPEAVLLYLETVKESRSATRIAQDLVEHGYTTTAGLPANTIRTTLRRLERTGDVVQVKKEWGLPAWYPGLRRNLRSSDGGTGTESHKVSRKTDPKKAAAKAKGGKAPKGARGGRRKNPWLAFYADQIANGKTMAEAAVLWKERKAKG